MRRDKLHRFYRPTQTNGNTRDAISLSYCTTRPTALYEDLEATVYYQYKKDTREDTNPDLPWHGWAVWRTYSADLQAQRRLNAGHSLTYGLHYDLDDGESPDDEQFTRVEPGQPPMKDAPDSDWTDLAAYLQDEWTWDRWTLTLAGRWDRFRFKTTLDDQYQPPSGDPEADRMDETEDTVTGGVAVMFRLNPRVHLVSSVFRGFRQYAPVFGIKPHAGFGIEVPSGLLEPAESLNGEVGVKVEHPRFWGNAFAYYTDLRNFPVARPGTYRGQDWYDWDRDGVRDPDEDVYIQQNAQEGYVYGTEIEAALHVRGGWYLFGGFAWNYGQDETNDEPLRHTQPARGIAGLRWEDTLDRAWFEVYADIVGEFDRVPADRIENDVGYRVNPQDRTSPVLYPLPGYTVIDLRGGYRLGRNVILTGGIENLADRKIRRAHSRWDDPGLNVVLACTVEWNEPDDL
jgi:hemoglobin/transferrin/lactoferrin receptor protein